MYQTFKDPNAALTALREANLGAMNYEIIQAGIRCQPVILCDLLSDVAEIQARGFNARLAEVE